MTKQGIVGLCPSSSTRRLTSLAQLQEPRPGGYAGQRRTSAKMGQSLSCAGAVVREAPEAQGDGAAVTRICPRWRGRAAAVVAAAASWRGTAEDLTSEPELPRQSWSRSSSCFSGAFSDTPASEPSPQPSFILSSSFLAEFSGNVKGEGPGTPQTPFAPAHCKCHYRHGPHHLLPLLPPLRQEADAHFDGWVRAWEKRPGPGGADGSLSAGWPRGLFFGVFFFPPQSAAVGEGRRAGGREEFLKGNNGVKGGRPSQMCGRGWKWAVGKVSSFWVWRFFACLIWKPDTVGRRCEGSELSDLPSPEEAGEAHSERAIWLPSSRVWAAVGREGEARRLQPSSSLLSAPCTHSAHSQHCVSEQSPTALSRPGQEVARPSAVAQEHLAFRGVRNSQRAVR